MNLAKTVKPCCEEFPFVETGFHKDKSVHVRLLDMEQDLGDFSSLEPNTLTLRCSRCGKEAEPAYAGGFVLDSDGNVELLSAAEADELARQFEEAKALGTGPFVFVKPKTH